jgi:hypothetical protein
MDFESLRLAKLDRHVIAGSSGLRRHSRRRVVEWCERARPPMSQHVDEDEGDDTGLVIGACKCGGTPHQGVSPWRRRSS